MKNIIVMLTMLLCCVESIKGQMNEFEGEMNSKIFQSQKIEYAVTAKDLVAKSVLNSSMKKAGMKKAGRDNPMLYNGAYTSHSVNKYHGKDFKKRQEISYNNSVVIMIRKGDIQKGYYRHIDVEEVDSISGKLRDGEIIEKTGETMVLLGRKCVVYRQIWNRKTETMGHVVNNYYAVSDDESLPLSNEECLPGVKGVPLKFVTNIANQTTANTMNLDTRMNIACEILSIIPRKVDDSEFDIPAEIRIIDGDKYPDKMKDIAQENNEYLKKHNLWIDPIVNEDKIYDNLMEEWDF